MLPRPILSGLWPPPAKARSFREPLLRNQFLENGINGIVGAYSRNRPSLFPYYSTSASVRRPSVDPFPPPTWLSRFSPSFSVPSFTWNLISWLAEGRRWRRRANMAEKAKKVEGTVSLQNISRRPSQELSYWLLKTLKILITVSPCTNNETIQF